MLFATYYLLERLEIVFQNYELFLRCDKLLELEMYQSEGDILRLVFAALCGLGTTVLKASTPRPPVRVFVELDEDSNLIRSSCDSDVQATTFFASPSVIFSQIPWPELEKGLHPPKVSLSGPVGSIDDPKQHCVEYQGEGRPSTTTTDPKVKTEKK